MEPKKIEQRGLIVGIIVNSLMAISSFIVYQVTKIQAMFLDASFITLTVLSTIIATLISRYSIKRSPRFPTGLFVLEPLYGIIRALMILTLTVLACIKVSLSAWRYFAYGEGEVINVLPIIPYEILAVILCSFLYYCYTKYNKQINNVSTMLNAEAKSTLLDGIMCAGIAVLAIFVYFISPTSPFSFLLYTGDFFITVALSLAVIKEPFIVLKKSFIELANGTILNQEQQQAIEADVQNFIHEPSFNELHCQIFKVGVSLQVKLIVKRQLAEYIPVLAQECTQLEQHLSNKYGYVNVELVID